MQTISWDDFEKINMCVGTIVSVKDFPEARNPAYKIAVDFGEEVGIKKTSAQVTHRYQKSDLLEKQVFGVINFPPKQIGPFMSEFLLCGVYQPDGSVIIATVDKPSINGAKLS